MGVVPFFVGRLGIESITLQRACVVDLAADRAYADLLVSAAKVSLKNCSTIRKLFAHTPAQGERISPVSGRTIHEACVFFEGGRDMLKGGCGPVTVAYLSKLPHLYAARTSAASPAHDARIEMGHE